MLHRRYLYPLYPGLVIDESGPRINARYGMTLLILRCIDKTWFISVDVRIRNGLMKHGESKLPEAEVDHAHLCDILSR